jgi:hypothetical protein
MLGAIDWISKWHTPDCDWSSSAELAEASVLQPVEYPGENAVVTETRVRMP